MSSSFPTSLHKYTSVPGNSCTNSFTLSKLSPEHVQITFAPCSYEDCAAPHAILHLFLTPIITTFLPSNIIFIPPI